jgi:hypothetical protein
VSEHPWPSTIAVVGAGTMGVGGAHVAPLLVPRVDIDLEYGDVVSVDECLQAVEGLVGAHAG